MDIDIAKESLIRNRERAPYLSGWRHMKTGTVYAVQSHVLIEATLDPAVVYYQRHGDPVVTWCRPANEFFDGRFERVETQ